MNHRIDDLIALAALGELTEQDATELDAAVLADPEVAQELADALASAAALQASPVEQPPPSLRASVLDAIVGLTQDGPKPEQSGVAAPSVVDPAVVDPVTGTTEDGTSWVEHSERARHRRRFAPLLAAAAALLLVVGGAIVVTNRDATDDPIAEVVEADDATSTVVAGEMGELEMWYSPEQRAVVLVGDSLAPLPEGSTYQVWLVADSGPPTSVGTFEPSADGSMAMRLDSADPAGSVMKITVEPAGGSSEPTGPVMASA